MIGKYLIQLSIQKNEALRTRDNLLQNIPLPRMGFAQLKLLRYEAHMEEEVSPFVFLVGRRVSQKKVIEDL